MILMCEQKKIIGRIQQSLALCHCQEKNWKVLINKNIEENITMDIYKELLLEVGLNSAIQKYGNKIPESIIR